MHGAVRGTIFGQYGEASIDVHTLVQTAARELARRRWRRYGARDENEAYAFFVAAQRRELGVAVVREFARHRLRRIPFIGMTVAQVRAASERVQLMPASRNALGPDEDEYFRYIQGAFYGGAAAAGG